MSKMLRLIRLLALPCVVAVAGVAIYTGTATSGSHATPKSPEPKASVFLSPSGSDSSACAATSPCLTLDRAWKVARPGQIVQLAGGTYQGDTLSGGIQSKVVVFRPAKGATVTISGEVRIENAGGIEFQNMSIDDYYVAYSQQVTFRNITARLFFIRASSGIRILRGSVGPSQDSSSPTIGGYDAASPSHNVIVDGVYFHDIGRQLSPTGHVECLFVQESDRVTIRNSKFRNCDVMDLYVNPIFGGSVANLTVENNWFDQPSPTGFYGIDMSPQPNLTISYNSFDTSFRLSEGAWTNALVVGNVGRLNNCNSTGIVWSHNVWNNLKCPGSSDIVAPSGFRDPTRFDLRLKRKAAAVNRGDPRRYPKRDIAGQRRPKGPRPDAGAYETR